jgi:4-hydroxy-tetrahydrodipicolinate reductase
MNTPLRIVQYGLGPIGQATAGAVLAKQDAGRMELVGAIDVDPEKVGRDVSSLLDEDRAATGVLVSDDPDSVLGDTDPDVVLHTTTSFLDGVGEQFMQCMEAGAHVVSSTEELSFPYDRHPDRAEALDQAAREAGVVLIGTGVNPGYAMDTLPLTATGVCTDVDAVHVERIVDAGERRAPLQKKVGAGISTDAFAEKKATGGFGHIGLRESLLMVAQGLGWSLDAVDESLEPVLADESIETNHVSVSRGDVAGIHHAAAGIVDGKECLTLDLKMYVGAEDPRDAVEVQGAPPIDLIVEGGIFGDTATVGMLLNVAPLVEEVSAGLKTMKDLPMPRAFGTQPTLQ